MTTSDAPRRKVIAIGGPGQAASHWAELQRAAPTATDFHAVQLPGRQERFSEGPLTTRQSAVADIHSRVSTTHGAEVVAQCDGGKLGIALGSAIETRDRIARIFLIQPYFLASDSPSFGRDASSAEFVEWLRHNSDVPAELLDSPSMFRVFEATLRADFQMMVPRLTSSEADLAPSTSVTIIAGADVDAATLSQWRSTARMHGWTHEVRQSEWDGATLTAQPGCVAKMLF